MKNFFYYLEFVFSDKDIVDNYKFDNFFNTKIKENKFKKTIVNRYLPLKTFDFGIKLESKSDDIDYLLGKTYVLTGEHNATFNICKYTTNKDIEDIFADYKLLKNKDKIEENKRKFKNKFFNIYDDIINGKKDIKNIEDIKKYNPEMVSFINNNNKTSSKDDLFQRYSLELIEKEQKNKNKELIDFLKYLKTQKVLRQIEYEVYVTENNLKEYNLAFRPVEGEYLTKLNSKKHINSLLNNIFKIVLGDNAFKVNNKIINVFSALRMNSSNKKKKSNEEQNISKDLIRAKAGKSGARHFIYEKFLKKYLIGKNYNLKIGVNSLQIIPKNFNKS